jgi:PhnB protein
MKTNLHLVFTGGVCPDAFAFYETVFNTKRAFTMKYGDAPGDMPIPEEAKNLVMHTSMPLGSMQLMGCDAMPGMKGDPIGGFHISVEMEDEAEVKRIYEALTEGGKVVMPLTKTFWSPLFGMLADKFGVEWMVSVPGPQM